MQRKSICVINFSWYLSGLTPLHIAVSNGLIDIVDLLCSSEADLTAQEGSYGRTPLHFAADKESKESIISTMIILKKAGSRRAAEDLVNIQNYRGDTPLHCAASSGFTTLCALLLYHGVSLSS
jgi:ankyrin repeat protein